MSNKRALQPYDLRLLDREIKRRHPTLTDAHVQRVRSKLIKYVANGLANGFDVALIKVLSEEEMSIKILRMREEDK